MSPSDKRLPVVHRQAGLFNIPFRETTGGPGRAEGFESIFEIFQVIFHQFAKGFANFREFLTCIPLLITMRLGRR